VIVTVRDDDHDIDHLLLFVIFPLLYVSRDLKFKRKLQWFSMYNWKKTDISLYISTLPSLLSLMRVPYQILQHRYIGSDRVSELNSYYKEIVSCLKEAEGRAGPLECIPIRAQKSI